MKDTLSRGNRIPWFKKEALSRKIEPLRRGGTVALPLPDGLTDDERETLARPHAVKAGDCLWDAPGALPLYAPVSGEVLGLEPLFTAAGEHLCLTIRFNARTGSSVYADDPEEDVSALSPEAVREIARQAAIVDELDGVPLFQKLVAFSDGSYEVLIPDGVEPEPYACSSHAVLKEHGVAVLRGAELAAIAAGLPRGRLAVQLKSKQQEALEKALGKENVYGVPNHYPVRQFVPEGKNAAVARVGVQACLLLYRAATRGEPALSTVITVAGDAVQRSRNMRVPYGVTLATLFAQSGLEDDPRYAILGDALTGVSAPDDRVPVTPGITCVLGLIDRPSPAPHACIGCGRCARACQQHLLPYEIARRLENAHYDRLASLHPERCDACGNCSYVCPAGKDVTAQVLEAKETGASICVKWGDTDDI